MTVNPILNLYNPQNQTPEQLLAEFVDRKNTLQTILGIIGDNKDQQPQQHLMLIGPRGMGKTTLLCAIRYSVMADALMAEQWLPLQFAEEELHIGDLADFWLAALGHLEQAIHAAKSLVPSLQNANSVDLDAQAQAEFFKLLASTGKRAILLIDNLDRIFDDIDNGQALHKLRALWMTDPRIMVIGAAASYFDKITELDQAFYDFFRVFLLQRMNQQELEQCLIRYAQLLNDTIIPNIIAQQPERVAALRILTGGNPRLIKLGYRVLKEGLDTGLANDLEQLLDAATPYFKHRIDNLAKEARRCFDAIARRWDPVSVEDIRGELRKPSNYISSQLNRLINDGFIEEVSGDKKKRYQVSERFYNIYYLWRHSRDGRQRLRWLVVFMQLFYRKQDYRLWADRLDGELSNTISEPQRGEKLAFLHAMCSAADRHGRNYVFETLVKDAIKHNNRQELDLQLVEVDPLEHFGWRYLLMELVWLLPENLRIELGFKASYPYMEKLRKALIANDLLALADSRMEELDAWRMDSSNNAIRAGMILAYIFKRSSEAEVAYNKALAINPDNVDALNELGMFFYSQERYQEAEAAYQQALLVDPHFIYALIGLGNVLTEKGSYHEAELYYQKAMNLDKNVGIAHINLASLYLQFLNKQASGIIELLIGLPLEPDDAHGHWLLAQYWRLALPQICQQLTDNIQGAEILCNIVIEELIDLAATKQKDHIREALLALDKNAQAPFEPLLLALQAQIDNSILYRIAKEKRELVLDVMQRLGK